jgi:hypothetical protein
MTFRLPKHLVFLGDAVDLVLRRGEKVETIGWDVRHWLCTDEDQKRLFIIPALDERSPKGRRKKSERAYRQFHQRRPSGDFIGGVRITSAPKDRGRAKSVAYASRKWSGKRTTYQHDFEREPRVVQCGDAYQIAGPDLRVTSRGVEG